MLGYDFQAVDSPMTFYHEFKYWGEYDEDVSTYCVISLFHLDQFAHLSSIHLIQHSQDPSVFPVCEYDFSLLRTKLTKEKKAIEAKIKSINSMNVAELTKHMKAPLQDDEAAVILTSGFGASHPNVAAPAAASAPAAEPNVASAPKKKRTTSKLKKKVNQPALPPPPDPNIDSNSEGRDTKVTFAPSSASTPRASSSLVQNLEPATQKVVMDRKEIQRNLWKEMAKCSVFNAAFSPSDKKSNKPKPKKHSPTHHLSIMRSTDIPGFEIERLNQGVPFAVHPFKTLVASSNNHKVALRINELIAVGQIMKAYTIKNRMTMRDFLGVLKDLMFERPEDDDGDEVERILGGGPNINGTDSPYSVAKDKHLSDALCKIRFALKGALTSHVPQELESNKRNVLFFQMVVHYLISWFVCIDDAQVIQMIHYICWAVHYLIYLFALSGLLLHLLL
jgi:hypothetical protein